MVHWDDDGLTPEESAVWRIVQHHPGPKNAIKQSIVARMVGFSDTKPVRDITRSLNLKGYEICTTVYPPYGLYRATRPEHLERYAAQLKSREFGNRERRVAIEALIQRYVGQLELL